MADEDFQSIPRIALDTDDIVTRRNQRSPGGYKSGGIAGSGTLNPLLVKAGLGILCVLLLAFVAMTAYLGKQLKLTQQNLTEAARRIEKLETQLVSTDTTITKSEVLLAAKLRSIDDLGNVNKSEIRKLWGGYEKSNRAIEAAAVEIKKHQDDLKIVKPQLLQIEQQVATDSELLKNIDGLVRESGQRMEIAQENIANLTESQKEIKEKQLAMDADLGKRTTVLEDTAKSTDVFRRNTQDELRKLKEELIRQGQTTGYKAPP